ncbi:MAG: undecaprenyl-phosphate glucose phosphotransferase [Planctomycetota bacterium]
MLKRRHQLFVVVLFVLDALVVAAAAMSAWSIRRLLAERTFPHLSEWEDWLKEPLLLFVVPLGLICIRVSGLYRPRRDRTLTSELLDVARATGFTIGLLVFVLWAVGNDAIAAGSGSAGVMFYDARFTAPRFQILLLAPVLFVLLSSHRAIFRTVLRRVRARGWNQRHVLIVGTGRLGQVAFRTIERNSWTGMRPAGFVTHHPEARRETFLDTRVLGGLTQLDRVLDEHEFDAVYLALPGTRAGELPGLLQMLDRHAVDVRVVPDVPTRYIPQAMTVAELDGMPVLSYRESPLVGVGGMNKRTLDVIGAVVAIVLLSPLMLAVAAAVSLSSHGPVIFRQRRVSIGGEQFKIYKFRTMYDQAAEASPAWTQRNDPRVTHVGRFLRRTSLDELPQLFNVVRGEMSLVGPRPERPELIERFREDWRGYMLRHHVKAGMTGWAQVNGLRGDTSLRKRVQYDLFYVRNWSLLFDVRILILTLTRGFVNRNAY